MKCIRCGKENVDPVYPHTCTPPLALRLADEVDEVAQTFPDMKEVSDELRRLHAENEALRSLTKELAVIVKELCVCYNHPLPEATLARAGEVK
jgi:hypothetical protein